MIQVCLLFIWIIWLSWLLGIHLPWLTVLLSFLQVNWIIVVVDTTLVWEFLFFWFGETRWWWSPIEWVFFLLVFIFFLIVHLVIFVIFFKRLDAVREFLLFSSGIVSIRVIVIDSVLLLLYHPIVLFDYGLGRWWSPIHYGYHLLNIVFFLFDALKQPIPLFSQLGVLNFDDFSE